MLLTLVPLLVLVGLGYAVVGLFGWLPLVVIAVALLCGGCRR